MNKVESKKLLGLIISIYPRANYPNINATADAWAMVMPEISFKEAETALIKIMREKTFEPTPADIVNAVSSFKPDPDTASTFNEFWREIQDAIRYHGYNNWPKEWGHPAKNLIAAQFREPLCLYDNDQQTSIQAQVRNAYEAECKKMKEAKQNAPYRQMISEDAPAKKLGTNAGAVFKLTEKLANSFDMNLKINDDKKHPPEIHPLASDELKTA